MARDQQQGPMTEDELEAASDALDELREETRELLAEELGGDPDDYRAAVEPPPSTGSDTRSSGLPTANCACTTVSRIGVGCEYRTAHARLSDRRDAGRLTSTDVGTSFGWSVADD